MQEGVRERQISVVIPFYNAYDYFEETLESIRAQSYPVSEIIVVNDGCGKKAEDFLARFDGIQVHSLTPNQGVSTARNKGVEKAQNEWIAFLDADDHWLPDKLQKQIAFLDQNPEFDAVHTGVETFNKSGVVNRYINKPTSLSLDDLLKCSHVSPSSFLIKRSVFMDLDGFDTKMRCAEDHDFTIRMIDKGYSIGFIPEALMRLRREDHGNLSSNGRKIIQGHLQLVGKHKQLFKKHHHSRAAFLHSTFMTAGSKAPSIERKLCYLTGYTLKLISKSGNGAQ